MEAFWEQESLHAQFLKRLHWDRACLFLKDDEYLASLRHRPEQYHRDLRVFGHVFDLMGLDYLQEVFRASERLRTKAPPTKIVHAERPLRFPSRESFTADDIGIRKAASWLPREIVETILLFSEKEWNNRPELFVPITPLEYNRRGEYGFFCEENADPPSVRIM